MDAGVFGVECETDGRIAPVARKIGKKCPNSYQWFGQFLVGFEAYERQKSIT
jgi:hypothetical protein